MNLDDISLIKENEKFAYLNSKITDKDLKKKMGEGILDIFNGRQKEENANQKNFVFKMKCEKLSTTEGKPQA